MADNHIIDAIAHVIAKKKILPDFNFVDGIAYNRVKFVYLALSRKSQAAKCQNN
ncbi:MAG: hypothetical protein ACK5HT_03475 [Draconibacterium sp.]